MSLATIKIAEKTQKKFSLSQLEHFVNSEDFEDIVLGDQLSQAQTWETRSYASFKESVWL